MRDFGGWILARAGICGRIDQPKRSAVVSNGPLRVWGWAWSRKSPVSRVEIWLDDRFVGLAGLGRPRPDVAKSLGHPDAMLSGFEHRFDLRDLDPVADRASLRVTVTYLDGRRADIGRVPISINRLGGVQDPPAPEPRLGLLAGSLGRRREKIRLLCFARSLDHGGSQLRLKELMECLQATGDFETTVVAPYEGPLRHDLEAAGSMVQIEPSPMGGISPYEEELARTAAWAAGRFDIVLAATFTNFLGVELAGRLGLPSVWRIGESESLSTVAHWLGESLDPAVERRAHRALESATVVVFNSTSALRRHRRPGSVGCHAVLSTGTDAAGANAYRRTADRDRCRQRLGIESGRRLLICAGTVWPVKGQALLVAALRQLRPSHRPFTCVLIGQQHSEYARAVAAMIRRSGLDDCVRLLAFTDDLRDWWCAGDAAVLPSESESMPASVLEAMAFGLPAVASRVGGVAEIVEDGVTGWMCEPNDLGSLMGALERMLAAEPGDLRAMGDLAAARICRNQDSAQALSRMTDLLRYVSQGLRPSWMEEAGGL